MDRLLHHDFIRFEMLRKEYLNQTFNFLPEVQDKYDKLAQNDPFENAQRQITARVDVWNLVFDRESGEFGATL